MTEVLDFEPVSHTYTHRSSGRIIVNVTLALSLLQDFGKVDPIVLEKARLEGVDMHHMVDLYNKDDLDESTLPEWLVPRLAAYKRFLAESGALLIASECRLYAKRYDYCGTTDIIAQINLAEGRRRKGVMACIDLKRSFFGGRVIGFQTAAYAEAWNSSIPDYSGQRVTHRFALKLHADETYRLEPYADSRDFHHFLTCLNYYNLKESLK